MSENKLTKSIKKITDTMTYLNDLINEAGNDKETANYLLEKFEELHSIHESLKGFKELNCKG